MQGMCEDWETPGRILEIQEAVENFSTVWFHLWNMDPTPGILRRILLNTNYGSQTGEDEKGRVRQVEINTVPNPEGVKQVAEPDPHRIRVRGFAGSRSGSAVRMRFRTQTWWQHCRLINVQVMF